MPAYGIAAATEGEGLLPWSWAETRLRDARTYWIATVRADGAPHVAPVWACWFDDAVVFSTSPESVKSKNLARDGRCVVNVERGDDAVIVEGDIVPFNEARRADYVCAYEEKYDFDTSEMNDPLFAVAPRTVFAFIASDDRFTNTATRWRFGS
jgi:hypothetical protein